MGEKRTGRSDLKLTGVRGPISSAVPACSPGFDEFEVSLFGPGVGESILCHLGYGEWMVVDSCQGPGDRFPAPIGYLHGLGLEPSKCVKLVVATHWHDDHVRGMAGILQECKEALFYCSGAINSDQFAALAKTAAVRSQMSSSGLDEFNKILDILTERVRSGYRKQTDVVHWASANRRLWSRTHAGSLHAEVEALSPSDRDISAGFEQISTLLPVAGLRRRRIPAPRSNHAAIVLTVSLGSVRALLGSDLEATNNELTGWNAVVASHIQRGSKHDILKVPHHGSKNAHHEKVWSGMLNSNPVAILSSFSSGSHPLPSTQDMNRIRGLTGRAYCTSPPTGYSPMRRDNLVEKLMSVATKRRKITGPVGRITVRARSTDSAPKLHVDLSSPAFPL